MDETRFDDLSRRLGAAASRRAGLKAALGALLGGVGMAAAGLDADAKKKRRRRCRPACGPQQACVDRQCTCPNGGTVCGTNCCLVGQACEGGRCVTLPDPGACVAFGQVCKNVGVPCCDGLVCGSGQGGAGDVACYVPAGGACATTSECVFGSQCLMGLCVAIPQPEPTPIVQCTPTVDTSGNGVDRGDRLRQAFIDAANGGPSTIYLGSGTYDLGETGSGIVWDQPAKTVTLQTCPDVDAKVVGPLNGRPFAVSAGTVSFVGPGLSIIGGLEGVFVGVAGTARLFDVNVTGQSQAIYLVSAGRVEVSGGSVEGPTAFLWDDTGDPATLTCTSNPSITGGCRCGPQSKCKDLTDRPCCASWTS